MSPGLKLLLASVGAIYALKIVGLLMRGRPRTWIGLLAFLFAWPGVFPAPFRERGAMQKIEARAFLAAWARMIAGAAAIVELAAWAPRVPDVVLGWAGIAAMLLAVHFGLGDLLPWLLRWAGFAAPPLFQCPWRASSLAEFWGKRWNLAFVEMNRRWLLPPAAALLGARGARFAMFVLSGLLHELAISFPAGGGWGGPLAYFLLQGVFVEWKGRWRTWLAVLAPMPLLFHAPFRSHLIVPMFSWLHGLLTQYTAEWWLSLALYLAAGGHAAVLIGSLNAPRMLGWKEDIAQLRPFNRKIFWVYALYVTFCIVSFGVMTWQLHDSMLAGDRAARWLAGFIALFWSIRIAFDFWYGHKDWPRGNAFVAGHALLTSLFTALAIVYWAAAAGMGL